MQQLAIVGRLRSGAEPRAAELIAKGPPFDPDEGGLERHTVYLSAGEVVFVFEGPQVEWMVDDLVDDPFRALVVDAFADWRSLIEGEPMIARPAYSWTREAAADER
jgi:hypothetical protein